MLDAFEIINTSGVVLWSRSYAAVSPAVVNHFISDVFIEEKSSVAGAKDGASAAANPPYKHDQHSLRWTFSKELGIIFVVSTWLEESGAARLSHRADTPPPSRRLSTARSCTCRGSISSSTISKPSS
jgi:hypothetical protein